MPVKVGCASDYNKNRPERIQKKRDEETIVLVANKRYGWVTSTNTSQIWLRASPLWMNGKTVK